MNRIVTRLKSVPEGKGTMFDNTMIFYFPNSGETHHAHGTEFPFVVLSGANSKLNLGRRYIRLPYWGKEGHKTLGNFYTTILNAYGNPIKHYGDLDLSPEDGARPARSRSSWHERHPRMSPPAHLLARLSQR